jgi:hypothetical protein
MTATPSARHAEGKDLVRIPGGFFNHAGVTVL